MSPSLALLVLIAMPAQAAADTPVQKVLSMMQDMIAKGQKEKVDEAEVYKKYTRWTEVQDRDTSRSIKKSKETIEKLVSKIEKCASDIEDYDKDIAVLDGEIAAWEADQKAATELREGEAAEFQGVETDYSESLDALDRAINVLGKQNVDRAQAAALLQKTAMEVPRARTMLTALLQSDTVQSLGAKPDYELLLEAPEANAYEGQSGGIIDMLKKLKSKFREELKEADKAEANSRHAYDVSMLHLGDSISSAQEDHTEKSEMRASLATQAAEAKALLGDTRASLAEDDKYLKDVKATYQLKTAAFNENQKVRADEIEALTKAVEIISSGEVSGHADKHLPGLVQKPASLVQLGSAAERVNVKERVASFLASKATSLGSEILSVAAMQLTANKFNPFAKVVQMVKDLIARLEEEAEEEAGHKAWCDEELKKNKHRRDETSSAVAILNADIDRIGGEIARLGTQIVELAKVQTELAAGMAEATATREEEHAENVVTIKDAKEAQVAVSNAMEILKEFYNKQGSFLQRGGKQAKQEPWVYKGQGGSSTGTTEMAAYKGQGGSSTGVLGMLEVILSDFARLETDTSADEDAGQREYDSYIEDSKAEKEAKHKEEFDKSLIKDKKEFEMNMAKKDRAATQEELDAALEYFGKLKPDCLEVAVSYEERVKMRKEEIAALQEAYRVLNGESF